MNPIFPKAPIKRVASVTLGKMLQSSPTCNNDVLAPYLRAAHVQPGGQLVELAEQPMWFSPNEVRTLELRCQDVVMVEGGAGYGRSAYLAADMPGWGFQNSILRIRRDPTRSVGPFINYAFQAALDDGQIAIACNMATFAHFTAEKVGAFEIPVAPLAVQMRVVEFLDRETAQIDAFIADQEELIGLLAERRAATIESVFDRALERKPLRSTIEIAQTGPFGTQLSATEYVSGGTPVLNPTHIQKGQIEADYDVSVTPTTAAGLSRFAFAVGDIVLGRKGEVDKSALIDELYAGAICGSDSMLIRPDKWTNPRYLWWFFQSVGAHGQLERWSVGSTVTGLNQNTISQIRVPYGNANFQILCVHDLDTEVGELDAAIADAREAITLSRERRAALISAAVTGKIDVRSPA